MAKTPTQIGQSTAGATDTDNASKQSFVETVASGTGFQVSTVQNANLYIDINTSGALALALSRDGTTYISIMASKSVPIGMINVRVPAGWYVKLTGTPGNFVATAVID